MVTLNTTMSRDTGMAIDLRLLDFSLLPNMARISEVDALF